MFDTEVVYLGGSVLAAIILDLFFWIFRTGFLLLRKILSKEIFGPNNPAPQAYYPNLKIWGLGALLGTEYLALRYLGGFLKTDMLIVEKASWQGDVQLFGVLAAIVVTVIIFLWGIVRIARDD